LQALDTSGVNLDLTEGETTNQARPDLAVDSGIQKEILDNAPAKEDGYIKVRSVF
jgi:aspartyl/glutamyl-tRNA(Asn/Gln) amidotransferase C subunit